MDYTDEIHGLPFVSYNDVYRQVRLRSVFP